MVCVKNDGGVDLELRKVYEVVPDQAAAKEGYVRVLDESGEDYLYPGSYLVRIDLSQDALRALRATEARPPRTS